LLRLDLRFTEVRQFIKRRPRSLSSGFSPELVSRNSIAMLAGIASAAVEAWVRMSLVVLTFHAFRDKYPSCRAGVTMRRKLRVLLPCFSVGSIGPGRITVLSATMS
jgi:hypothetical protein